MCSGRPDSRQQPDLLLRAASLPQSTRAERRLQAAGKLGALTEPWEARHRHRLLLPRS